MHGQELLERLAALTTEPVQLADVHAKWLDMFVIDTAMVELAHRLSERYRVYLLSNIGDLHWAHLCARVPPARPRGTARCPPTSPAS